MDLETVIEQEKTLQEIRAQETEILFALKEMRELARTGGDAHHGRILDDDVVHWIRLDEFLFCFIGSNIDTWKDIPLDFKVFPNDSEASWMDIIQTDELPIVWIRFMPTSFGIKISKVERMPLRHSDQWLEIVNTLRRGKEIAQRMRKEDAVQRENKEQEDRCKEEWARIQEKAEQLGL